LFSSPERHDVSYAPMIETIKLLEPSADFLAPGDRIHQIDGMSTIGLTNEQVHHLLLHNREENAVIEIEYSLPDYRKSLRRDFVFNKSYRFISLSSIAKQFVRHNKVGTSHGRA